MIPIEISVACVGAAVMRRGQQDKVEAETWRRTFRSLVQSGVSTDGFSCTYVYVYIDEPAERGVERARVFFVQRSVDLFCGYLHMSRRGAARGGDAAWGGSKESSRNSDEAGVCCVAFRRGYRVVHARNNSFGHSLLQGASFWYYFPRCQQTGTR